MLVPLPEVPTLPVHPSEPVPPLAVQELAPTVLQLRVAAWPTEIVDGQAGTITATYTADGRVATETWPNGIQAVYYYDSASLSAKTLRIEILWERE